MSKIKFIYFDLGNVLLRFDHDHACNQIGHLSSLPPSQVKELLFNSDLQKRYERGEISTVEFHQLFCENTGVTVDLDELCKAASNIFQPKEQTIKLVETLKKVGHKIGLLSNTCECHWQFCLAQPEYGFLTTTFDEIVLSFEAGHCKPELEIYQIAANQAGHDPSEILFIDDLEDNINSARNFGFETIQYLGLPMLVKQLIKRRIMS